MQQPQSRPLLGDSVSSTTSPTTRRNNNPVAVLTQQQLQQLQQLQSQNSGQSVTFTLQQPSGGNQEQTNGSTAGNHILYLNQLNQLNQGPINTSGTGMGLPQATPTFGVGLNMGLPLSLLNTSLTSLTSNAITTSNPLLNLSLPSINSGLTAINPSINQLSALGTNLNSNLPSDSISNGLSNLGQDLSAMNSGINRLGALNSTNINSGLSNINTGLTSVNPNLTSLNTSTINQNLATINTNLSAANSGTSTLNTLNSNLNISTNINSALNQQGLNRSLNTITNFNSTSSSAQFPFQTIQSIQSIAPHIVGSSIANVVSSAISQNQNNTITSTVQSSGSSSSVTSTHSNAGPILTTTINAAHGSNTNHQINIAQFGIMSSNTQNVMASQISANESNPNTSVYQRQFTSQNLSQSSNTNQSSNPMMPSMKTMQGIQNQTSTSPSSPFSIPLKSPASNIAPPTPSPSPNRLLLRSPASNSIQSRNSPSPVSVATSNANFGMQLQSPMQSPISVGQIQSPVQSPYPPAKSPHPLGAATNLSNKSPAPGGSPGPPVVRPNTPILQQGMQVLQIIGAPQSYQQTPQLVTRTHIFGNQQIQIAATKPNKQPPQILPKPPLQQTNVGQQKQRVTTTITNQVTQQTQPQLVLASPQQNPSTATMIPTAQGLLLNQVLPSTGPVIVQQQPGGVQLILRTPANAQQQTHTAQLTQQQLVRVVTAQGMQLQGLTPTFFAVPNGFSSPAPPVIRHTPSSPAPSNSANNGSIVIQNTMVQNSQPQITQTATINATGNVQSTQTLIDQSLLPPPKKKAKKKKKTKKKDEEPPKLDLASIMKISGIGDDDDIFDNDLVEPEAPPQSQVEVSPLQNSPLVTIPNTSVQQNVIHVPASNPSNVLQTTTTTQENVNSSQLVAQLQTPVQNAISGQLRLAIGEDGRVVLHHTPDPNQPEIDQATAQALIRSLTQGGGQNSQIISQLLQAQSSTQASQNPGNNRQKFVKSPVTNILSTGSPLASPSGSQNATPIMNSPQVHISSSPSNIQNFNISGVHQNPQQVLTASVQSSNTQSATIVTSPNPNQQTKNIVSKKILDTKKQTIVEVKPSPCHKITVQNPRTVVPNQMTNINQQTVNNIQQSKCNQTKARNICLSSNQQNLNKQIGMQLQKPVQTCAPIQRNVQIVKNSPNQLHQISIQEDGTFLPQNTVACHQNVAQQVSTSQTVQTQNMQHVFEQNLQQNIGATLQRTSTDGVKIESINLVQQSTATNLQQPQQQNVNIIQQNIGGSLQSIEPTLQFTNDLQLAQQQNVQINVNNSRQQKGKQITSTANQSLELQNLQASILISNSPCSTPQQEQQKVDIQNSCNITSSAASILSSAPKITPDILNTLSNLNPNDQLLIANANGQMQVISQQLLQQFLSGQFNLQNQQQAQTQAQNQGQQQTQAQAQTQHQNQTQKIVIGDPDSNNANLQEVQINTPTSQIIVNSSGGAPTIQNNIQNIVVQAAPTQIPQQIQIQNSGFPSQFIDNLNQQQIRNLGNNTTSNQNINQNTNQTCPPKKTKIVKRTKVVTVTQQTAKSVSVSRPLIITTTTATTTTAMATTMSPQQKLETTNKMVNFLSQVVDSSKNESPVASVNGPVTSLAPSCQVPILSTGQVVQRVQTIQLSSQKQQLLSSNQAQIRTILSRKSNSQADQMVLSKLYQEQARILASGKVISSTSHPISSESDNSISANMIATSLTSSLITPTTCKNLMSTAQTQTPTSTPTSTIPVSSQNINLTTSSPSSLFIPSIVQTQPPESPQSMDPLKHQQQQKTQVQAQVQVQTENSQMLVPSNANAENFDGSKMVLEVQHSAQCQAESIDIKPSIQVTSPVIKQELPSPVHLQPQSTSPAGQVISPRMVGKSLQTSQNKILSPDNPSSSPRQGIKRTLTSSPVCRQVNRAEAFEQQLKIDQNGATNPDVNTPFQSKLDACKRLVRYHCYNEQVLSSKDLEKADEIFEETAKHLLSKFNSMMNKYTYLLIMESMRETRTSELMMIDRMIVNEEQATLNRLREHDIKLSVEEIKTEEKLLVPKLEPEVAESEMMELDLESTAAAAVTTASATASVKVELEMEVGVGVGKSADYDEWLEIQKELGVYTSTELAMSGKCRTKSSRTRANGDTRLANEASASELERDLLEDTESLDGLALYAQAQSSERNSNPEEHDDITAQVQSAIDSILSLKKRPTGGATQAANSQSSSTEPSDKILDQAVRSILGS